MVPYRTLILFLELDKKASGEEMGEKPESPSILSSHLLTSHFPKTKTNNAGFAWESGPPPSSEIVSPHWINQSRSQFKAATFLPRPKDDHRLPKGQGCVRSA
jgi:hypothetical protein